MFKKDDIVVRIGGSVDYFGTIYKCRQDSNRDYSYVYSLNKNPICPDNSSLRKATLEEINAFNSGIRNIEDIKNYVEIY